MFSFDNYILKRKVQLFCFKLQMQCNNNMFRKAYCYDVIIHFCQGNYLNNRLFHIFFLLHPGHLKKKKKADIHLLNIGGRWQCICLTSVFQSVDDKKSPKLFRRLTSTGEHPIDNFSQHLELYKLYEWSNLARHSSGKNLQTLLMFLCPP